LTQPQQPSKLFLPNKNKTAKNDLTPLGLKLFFRSNWDETDFGLHIKEPH